MRTRLCIITQPVIENVNNTEKNRIFLYSRKFFFRLQLDLRIALALVHFKLRIFHLPLALHGSQDRFSSIR